MNIFLHSTPRISMSRHSQIGFNDDAKNDNPFEKKGKCKSSPGCKGSRHCIAEALILCPVENCWALPVVVMIKILRPVRRSGRWDDPESDSPIYTVDAQMHHGGHVRIVTTTAGYSGHA